MRWGNIPRYRHPPLLVRARLSRAARRRSADARGRVAHRHRARLSVLASSRAGTRERSRVRSRSPRVLLSFHSHNLHSGAQPFATLRLGRRTLLMLNSSFSFL